MKRLRQTPSGWQKFARIKGEFYQEHTTGEQPSAKEVAAWYRGACAEAEGLAAKTRDDSKGQKMGPAIVDYLASVTAMPSFVDRELHMNEWAAHFKGRIPNSIKPMEIRARLHTLRQTYAASSCNKRRTALMHFYTVTNGKSGYNPVRDVPKFTEDEEPRAQSLWTIYRVLALMQPSMTRVRLRVILWTGWPHAQLQRLKPSHLDLENGRAFVTPRRKGKGRQGVWLPLLPGAIIALKDFVQWDCFTPMKEKHGRMVPVPFSPSTMHRAFTLAVSKLNARRARFKRSALEIRPYDLRHSFLTWVASNVTDERGLQELAMHSRAEQSRRYTEAATSARVAATVATLSNIRKLA